MGVKYKFDAIIIASDKDHKITKIRHFVVYHKHSNVTFNIGMLLRLKVHMNVEHLIMHYFERSRRWQCRLYESDILFECWLYIYG